MSDDPEGPGGDFERAIGLLAMGQFGAAIEILKSCASRNPDRSEVWTALAQGQVAAKDDLGGLESAQQAIALEPNGPFGFHVASVALATMNRNEEAEQYARRAIEIAPNWSEPHRWLAEILLKTKARSQDAFDAASEAVRLAPNEPKTHVSLARALARLRKTDQARAELLAALSLDPGLNSAQELLAALGGPAGRRVRRAHRPN